MPFLVPFNGSTERALKGLADKRIRRTRDVPFNGSTERALKVETKPAVRPDRELFHSTAQQREH